MPHWPVAAPEGKLLNNVILNDKSYKVPLNIVDFTSLIVRVLNGREDIDGDIIFLDKRFTCPNTDVLDRYLCNFY